MDFLPANIELAGLETTLVNVMSRETIMRQYVNEMRRFYDYILIDTMPSLGMMTINALVAADSVLIPVEAAYLSVKGLQQLIKTIGRVHRQLNPGLQIEGILLTKVDRRTNFAKDISEKLRGPMERKSIFLRTAFLFPLKPLRPVRRERVFSYMHPEESLRKDTRR